MSIAMHALVLKTPLQDKFHVSHVKGNEELGRLFQFDLDVTSENPEIQIDDLLGQNVTLQLDIGAGESRYFNGIVSSFTLGDQIPNVGAVYHLTLRPWLWFLTRTADCRIFQDVSVPDIIKKILNDHGFSDVQDKLIESHKPWSYCVQYRETDFDFISRLMEEEGIYYYFTHDNGKHTLVLADSGSAHKKIRDDALAYYTKTGGNTGEVSEWTVRAEVQPGAFASNDYDFERPKAVLRVREQIQEKHAGSEYEIYDYPGEYAGRFKDTKGEYADIRIQELHVPHTLAEGVTDVKRMSIGGLFNLDKYPRKDQNKEYLVIRTTYDIGQSLQPGTDPSFECRFTVIDSKIVFRPPRKTPKPVVRGPQTAIVVGPDGEELWTDKYGRVKVQFYWDRHAQDEDSKENSSCWVRVSQPAAGGSTGTETGSKNWGGMFIPHIDDEVIVDFLEGDPDCPIITGRVFNADKMPLEELPDQKYMSGFRDLYGNEIIMDRTPGDEHIRLHSPHHDSTFELGRSVKYKTSSDWGTITKGNESDCRIGYKQSLTVGASTSQMLGLSSSVFVGGQVNASLSAVMDLTAGVKYSADMSGSIAHAYSYSYKQVKSKEITQNNAEYVKHANKEVRFDSEERVLLVGGDKDAAIVSIGKRGKTGPNELTLEFGKGTTGSGLVTDSATKGKMFGAAIAGALATLGATAAGAAAAAKGFNTKDDTSSTDYPNRNLKNINDDWLIPTMAIGGTVGLAAGAVSIGLMKNLMKRVEVTEPSHTTVDAKITLNDQGVLIEAGTSKVEIKKDGDIVVYSKTKVGIFGKQEVSLTSNKVIKLGKKEISMQGKITHANLTVAK